VPGGAVISVVVPVGRVDTELAEQMWALARQADPPPFEVLLALNVRDAGAAGRLEELVRRVDAARFTIVRADARPGAAAARNLGAAAARGDLLAFCDSDDVVSPTWLARLVAALTGDVAAAGGHLEPFGLPERQLRARPPATPGDLPRFMGVPYAVSANLAIRRSVFEEVGGFDEALVQGEDIALSWRVRARGYKVAYAPDAVVAYRHRAGVWRMVRQHYAYGVGLAQVLARYPMDELGGTPQGLGLLKPNGQPGARRSALGLLRRGSLAVGRFAGVVQERRRPGPPPPDLRGDLART